MAQVFMCKQQYDGRYVLNEWRGDVEDVTDLWKRFVGLVDPL